MPRYVVVDSQDNWLELGEYNSPEEALAGGMQSSDFATEDKPFEIWVFEYTNEFVFKLDLNSMEYTKEP